VKAAPLRPRRVLSTRLPRHRHRKFSWGGPGGGRRIRAHRAQAGIVPLGTGRHRRTGERKSRQPKLPSVHRLVSSQTGAQAQPAPRRSRMAARVGSHRGYSACESGWMPVTPALLRALPQRRKQPRSVLGRQPVRLETVLVSWQPLTSTVTSRRSHEHSPLCGHWCHYSCVCDRLRFSVRVRRWSSFGSQIESNEGQLRRHFQPALKPAATKYLRLAPAATHYGWMCTLRIGALLKVKPVMGRGTRPLRMAFAKCGTADRRGRE
jgi:hypothetical protein